MHDGPDDVIAPAPPALTLPPAPAAKPPAAGSDLSGDIERQVGREPLDRVRCARVFGDFYRCNGWSPPGETLRSAPTEWLTISTQRVRKSSFLNVTTKDGKLLIQEVSEAARE